MILMKYVIRPAVALLTSMSLLAGNLLAQEAASPTAAETENTEAEMSPEEAAFVAVLKSIDWEKTGEGKVGEKASIKVPEGYLYTGKDGTVKLMSYYGNLVSGLELGYIAPENLTWFAVFEFEESGYVKDDDKDKLDADAMMEQMIKNQQQANEQLRSKGLPTLELRGWHTKPFYNPETNNLEWAIRLSNPEGEETINYKTKLLGRRGVMDVVLVCDESQLSTVVPEYQKLLAGYAYTSEESYAAFQEGDKVAEYGLAGLIVGGGLLAAAKSGLLAKLWKPIMIGLLAVGAFIKRLFGRKGEA